MHDLHVSIAAGLHESVSLSGLVHIVRVLTLVLLLRTLSRSRSVYSSHSQDHDGYVCVVCGCVLVCVGGRKLCVLVVCLWLCV